MFYNLDCRIESEKPRFSKLFVRFLFVERVLSYYFSYTLQKCSSLCPHTDRRGRAMRNHSVPCCACARTGFSLTLPRRSSSIIYGLAIMPNRVYLYLYYALWAVAISRPNLLESESRAPHSRLLTSTMKLMVSQGSVM